MSDLNDKNDDEVFMDDLKEEFIKTVAQNLIDLQTLIEEKKFEEVAKIAHDIKGMAGAFGFPEGSDIAKDLQISAQNKNYQNAKELINQLVAYMKENGVEI